jgi:hypothetical protein
MFDQMQPREPSESVRRGLTPYRQLGRGNLVIYSTIFGGSDRLHELRSTIPCADAICFTDNAALRSPTWRVVYVDWKYRDPRRTAKAFKILPHLIFPFYDHSLYLDGSAELLKNPEPWIDGSSFRCFAHPWRICLFKEGQACIASGKEERELVDRQLSTYRMSGYRENAGLIAGGVLLRRHHDPLVSRTMGDWWAEIDAFSARDLLSFNFVAWQNNLQTHYIPGDIFKNHFLKWHAHAHYTYFNTAGKTRWSFRIWLAAARIRLARLFVLSLGLGRRSGSHD